MNELKNSADKDIFFDLDQIATTTNINYYEEPAAGAEKSGEEIMDDDVFNELYKIVQEADILIKDNLAECGLIASPDSYNSDVDLAASVETGLQSYGDFLLFEEISSIQQMSNSVELEFSDTSNVFLQNAVDPMMTY